MPNTSMYSYLVLSYLVLSYFVLSYSYAVIRTKSEYDGTRVRALIFPSPVYECLRKSAALEGLLATRVARYGKPSRHNWGFPPERVGGSLLR